LIHALGAPVTVALDAMSYAISALLVGRLPADRTNRSTPRRQPFAREVREGLRLTFGEPTFRTLTLTNAISNACAAGLYSLTIVYLVEVLDVRATALGALAAVGGIGGAIGAAIAGRLIRRAGPWRAWRGALVVAPLWGILIPMATPDFGLALFVLGNVGLSTAIAVGAVVSSSVRQALCPPALIGRMSATSRVVTWGVIPFGALLAGGLASAIGIRGALWVIAAGFCSAPLLVAMTGRRSARDLEDAFAGRSANHSLTDSNARPSLVDGQAGSGSGSGATSAR
jgi:predicted MFS family arabinose efflux permease